MYIVYMIWITSLVKVTDEDPPTHTYTHTQEFNGFLYYVWYAFLLYFQCKEYIQIYISIGIKLCEKKKQLVFSTNIYGFKYNLSYKVFCIHAYKKTLILRSY